ncbi:MAG: VWA domain-containing protein [Armatimonadetes bacterium]|nr:VWA domain-containing protein [Armatimonadota bacterium]
MQNARRAGLNTSLAASIVLLVMPCLSTAQDGVSTASAARTRYLGYLGVIPSSQEIAVEDFVNYHRHEIGRPRAGEAVGLDVRWSSDPMSEGSAFLQVGLSTALINDRQDRRSVNLALVIDKSGSMAELNKMTRVKAALLTLVSKLNDTDVLSIVVFDSEAQVLLPATRLANKQIVNSAIRSIQPGGYTNIDAGLSLGYQEALKQYRKDATNRVILLTDGIANRGVTDPDQIANGSLTYNDRGIDLSTIGVGQDLNHVLLSTLAKSGRGLFHFVADAQDIEKVFSKEVQSLLSPVAVEPKVEIEFPRGVRIDQVYGYDPKVHGNKIEIKLENMNSGMTEVILVRFSPRGSSRVPVKVKLTYYDLDQKKQVTKTERTTVSFKGRALEDSSVAKNATIAVLAQAIRDMAASCEAGRTREAERLISAAISAAYHRYPNMEDPDIKRTLAIAETYQRALSGYGRESEPYERSTVPARPTKTAMNPMPTGDFSTGNAGFSSGLRYTPPSKNCLWRMGYTVAPKWNDPLLHRLFITSEEYLAPKRPTGREQVFFANAGGTDSLLLWTAVVACKPNTTYKISFQSVSLNAGREWIPTYEILVGGERSQPQPAGYGKYAEISMLWHSGATSSTTVSIVRMPIPHGGGLIAIANIEMVEVD